MVKQQSSWIPKFKRGSGPAYLLIASAIADDIAIGQLQPQQRLPPQRKLAQLLGLDFTTIARAYREANQRGLVEAVVGRGTFVSGRRRARIPHIVEGRPNVDLSMNMPPEVISTELSALMQDGFARVGTNLGGLMRYQDFCGSTDDRLAGAMWLKRRGLAVEQENLLVMPGAQSALLVILTTIAGPGSIVCCEELTYPGLRALAGQLGIRLIGLPMDAEGIDALAFATACSQYAPKALYCNPTLLNPTTLTISGSRRQALVDVARNYDVAIIEDDAYGFLPKNSPPPIASLGPDITFYVSGLAKCLGAGLRVAYVVAPDQVSASRLALAVRTTTVMVSPITAALATRWIRDGTADLALSAIRKESIARQRLVSKILPPGCFNATPDAFHLWVRLPPPWSGVAFADKMQQLGIGVVASAAFVVGIAAPAAVRVCLGGIASREEVSAALAVIADLLLNTSQKSKFANEQVY